jgi:16S rRNA (guanine527-N7)-methyltransferase
VKPADPFEGYPLERRIVERAGQAGLAITAEAATRLATHARTVMQVNPILQLTAITDPAEYVERHLGESFEGAAMLGDRARGLLLDLGSGNGYPGIPVSQARPGLQLVMAEASRKKADFLRGCIEIAGLEGARVHEAQVQRPGDLENDTPIDVLVCRAMGNWQKVLPRLAASLAPDGHLLLWGGADVEEISTRAAWQRLALAAKRPLPSRDHSWIWHFFKA